MATSTAGGLGDETLASGASPRRSQAVTGNACGYGIEVIACDVPDLIRSAGGWLVDRVHTGWTVTVVVTEPVDIRPLQILGLPTVYTDARVGSSTVVNTLAVSADVVGSDESVRENVMAALRRADNEVVLWGDALPLSLRRHVETVEYRLSSAARAFKAQALLAASLPHQHVDPTETLYSGRRDSY